MSVNSKNGDKKAVVVPALEKALDIMEFIAHQGSYVTAKEIATRLGIPVATTYRTVNYLCSRNYLKEDTYAEGRYFLGPQLLYLAHLAARQIDVLQIARPYMKELAMRTGQTVQLGILQGSSVIYIDQAQPAQPVNIIAALRTEIPLNLSASGKILAAFLDEDERDALLNSVDLAQQTPNSITELGALKEELAIVRQSGYAMDNEEYARGIGCLAAPIRDYRQQVVAAIGITGHIANYTDAGERQSLIDAVCEVAQQISQIIGIPGVERIDTH